MTVRLKKADPYQKEWVINCNCFNEQSHEAVSKVYFTENQPRPNPKGKADFLQLPPFREGQEVAEKGKIKTFETASV